MRSFFAITVAFFSLNSFSQIIVNEYSAANYDDFNDNYGQNEDWFELYNTSGTAINLNGYYVSDKNNNLTKWQFTSDVNINPNEHLVIFCSGRDEINGGNIHTSFKLHQTKGNEWIILTDPDGTISISLGAYGVPETFLLNNKSKVIKKYIGPLTKENVKEIINIVKS